MSTPKSYSWRLAAAVATLALAGCQTPPSAGTAAAQAGPLSALAQASQLRQDMLQGAYEVTHSPVDGLFVAATPSFEREVGGLVYRMDPRSLQLLQTIQLPRKAFALGLNPGQRTLYVGNTLDGSLTVLDAATGQIKGQIQLALSEKDKDGKESTPHTRKVIIDEARNRVFVTSPGQKGKVWIVDGANARLLHTIDTGLWTAGAAYDTATNRLYVSQGGVNEILAIDPDSGTIVQRYSTGDSAADTREASKHFFINLAFDTKGQRLFATDPNTNQVYVFHASSGELLHRASVGGGALDILHNPQRNELVTTHRGVTREQPGGTGAVTIFDATSFAVKRVVDLPVHPNSLALSGDGQTLFVTVKAPHGNKHPDWRKGALDSIVRIDLH